MKNAIALIFGTVLLAGPLTAQEKPAAEPDPIYSATIIVRKAGDNFPDKFTSYLSGLPSELTMPLLSEQTSDWVARIQVEDREVEKPPVFSLRIEDTSRLEPRSSEQIPIYSRPVEILSVRLPMTIGQETTVFKSKDISIWILFEAGAD